VIRIHVKMMNQQEQRRIDKGKPPAIWKAWIEGTERTSNPKGSAADAVFDLLWYHGQDCEIHIVEHEQLC
jgi:hypothetical protein